MVQPGRHGPIRQPSLLASIERTDTFMAPRKKLGIVTPCYNEEGGIAECYERVRDVLAADLPQYDYEHLFIDNCSQDRTVAILKEIAAIDKRVKIIVNSRNFGPRRSPYHAMMQTEGDAIIP